MKKVLAKIENNIILLSSIRCASFFDVSPKTLLEWKKAGCPQAKRGWWNPEEVYRWRCGLTEDKESGGDNWQAVKLKAEAEYRTAKAAQEKIRLGELQGQFISREQMAQAWASRLTVFRVNVFGWIHSLPPLLSGLSKKDLARTLEDEIYSLWDGFAREGPYTPTPEGKKEAKAS